MMLNNLPRLFTFILLITTGCRLLSGVDEYANTTQYPLLHPLFVLDVEYRGFQTVDFDESICVELNQQPFWVSYTENLEHTDRVIEEILINVDDELVTFLIIEQVAMSLIHDVYDDKGQRVGWYPEPINVCFETSSLTRGAHTLSIEFTTITGLHNKFTWNFLLD